MPEKDAGFDPYRSYRPDDVPTWYEATGRSWNWSRWLLAIIPAAYLISIWFNHIAFLEPKTAEQARMIKEQSELFNVMMPCMAAFMWLIIFLNGIVQERWAKTPKEIEAKERAQLAALKRKYEDG